MILAAIEIAWSAIKLAFKNCDISEWMAEIVNQLMHVGFFYALLLNSVTWGTAIVNSFRQAASIAGATGMAPSDVFACGIRIATEVMHQMTILHPATSAGFMIAGIVIEVCFSLIAALMILTLVESYFMISANIIFMAFGGSSWTQQTAISAIRYCVSVGAKLFMIQLIVSIGSGIMQGWANDFTRVDDTTLCVIIGSAIVMLAIVKTLPDTIQAMVGGSSMSSTSAIVGAAMQLASAANAVASSVASAAVGAAGAGATAWQAGKLASAQSEGGSGSFAGNMAKNLGGAAMNEAGRHLRGDINSQHGHGSWRMASELSANRRNYLKDQKPEPPASPENSISS
jgi:type IV secretion system protein TrbL